MNQTKPKSDMIELCGLWLQKTKANDTYMTGKVGNTKFLVFRNKYKKSPKEPDYRIFQQKTFEQYPPPPPPEPKAPRPMTSPFSEQSMAPDNDDIPF